MSIIIICIICIVLRMFKRLFHPQQAQDEETLYHAVHCENKDEVKRLLSNGVNSTGYKLPGVSTVTFLYVSYLSATADKILPLV